MANAVVLEVLRTPIGRAGKGSLRDVRPDDLVAGVIAALLQSVPVDPTEIEDHVLGVGYPEREQGFCLGRRANHLAGLPVTVPGATVSRFCGSSLYALRTAVHGVRAGEGDLYLVSGVESVSAVGRTLREQDKHPRLTGDDLADAYIPMVETAERVAALTGVTRAELDEFALSSHQRAVSASDAGRTAREIAPVTLPDGATISVDDGPRRDTSLDKLSALAPLVRPDGVVTAGNSCPLNDGAAALLLANEDWASAQGLPVRARILSSAVSALDPQLMGLGPIAASSHALARAGVVAGQLDAVEINEAFAAQVLPCARELGLSAVDQVNLLGGSIALGHPFGMTGVRIIGTLLNALDQVDGHYGLATLCVGGGQGVAIVVERTR